LGPRVGPEEVADENVGTPLESNHYPTRRLRRLISLIHLAFLVANTNYIWFTP